MTRKTFGLAIAGLMAGAAVAAGAGQITALGDVMPGKWQLKDIDESDGAGRTVCLADPAQLLQIQHATATCTREVIDNGAKAVTVHYTCAGGGSGRTTLTVRSSQSVKVETQGMAGGAPFAFDYDARRIGDCPAADAKAGR